MEGDAVVTLGGLLNLEQLGCVHVRSSLLGRALDLLALRLGVADVVAARPPMPT